jgi:hypothetical protein
MFQCTYRGLFTLLPGMSQQNTAEQTLFSEMVPGPDVFKIICNVHFVWWIFNLICMVCIKNTMQQCNMLM